MRTKCEGYMQIYVLVYSAYAHTQVCARIHEQTCLYNDVCTRTRLGMGNFNGTCMNICMCTYGLSKEHEGMTGTSCIEHKAKIRWTNKIGHYELTNCLQ